MKAEAKQQEKQMKAEAKQQEKQQKAEAKAAAKEAKAFAKQAAVAAAAPVESPLERLEKNKNTLSSLQEEIEERKESYINSYIKTAMESAPDADEETAHVKALIELSQRELCALTMMQVELTTA